MKTIIVSIQNGLLAEAVTTMLNDSGEFRPFRVPVNGKKSDLVSHCLMLSAEIVLMEVAYTGSTTVEARLREGKELRQVLPQCKIILLCDENAPPELAKEVSMAKKAGLIDNFFYSSVTTKYLLAALSSL